MRALPPDLEATRTLPCESSRDADYMPVASHLGRYEVRGWLGEGGMGTVFEAFDPVLARAVAIKVIRRDSAQPDEHAARLLREAIATARLEHPNVIRVYDVGSDQGESFVVMELVRGRTLTSWTETAPRTTQQVISAYVQAGRGLAAAHDAGLVHRDFKPENVLVADDGRVLVIDFGLAREPTLRQAPRVPLTTMAPGPIASPFQTAPGQIVGTPEFMAPEQQDGGRVDARADQYSFCRALWQQLRDESGLPDLIRGALQRGLAHDPDRRFASMHELLAVIAPPLVAREQRSARRRDARRMRPTVSCSAVTRPGRVRPRS